MMTSISRHAALLIVLFVVTSVVCFRSIDFDYEYRLSDVLTPIVYELDLHISSLSDTIHAHARIQIQCENETSNIVLHADPLYINIKRATLENRLIGVIEPLKLPFSDPRRQIVTFTTPQMLKSNNVYYLNIYYSTRFSSDDRGLLRRDDPLRGVWLNTLLETTHARRVWPNFDEPKFRSSFQLTLRLAGAFADDDMIALSATAGRRQLPEVDVNTTLDHTIWTFAATPPLPSYLFSFAVGRLHGVCEQVSMRLHDDDQICVWRFAAVHRESHDEATARAIIAAAAKYKAEMTDWLLSDPNERLHFLFTPSQLKGMENYGLLNIRENLWPSIDEPASFWQLAQTSYHEITHQWFGNLVTPASWSDIWLSESLTTYISSFKPLIADFDIDHSLEPLVSARHTNRVPISVYTKGPILLEMLEAALTPKLMRRVLREYLHRHQYGAATTADFLDVLDSLAPSTLISNGDAKESAPTAAEFMRSWLHIGSHPIVFVDYDALLQTLTLSQTAKISSPHNRQWSIPIWTGCALGTMPERLRWLMPNQTLQLRIDELTKSNESIIATTLNKNRIVYYQVHIRY